MPTTRQVEPCPRCQSTTQIFESKRWRCRQCERARKAAAARRKRGSLVYGLWERSRQRAKDEGAPFALTVEDIEAVYPENGRCPALGIPLKVGRAGRPEPGSPSLDRVNAQWGYERSNIAVISMAANRAKNNLRAQDLEAIARWMRSKGLD